MHLTGLCPDDNSSLSDVSGISNVSTKTTVYEESSLVLETYEAGRLHHYLIPIQVAVELMAELRRFTLTLDTRSKLNKADGVLYRRPSREGSRSPVPSFTSTWTTSSQPSTSSCECFAAFLSL